MKKRFLAVLAALTLAMSFTACGENSDKDKDTDTKAKTSASAKEDKDKKKADDKDDKKDSSKSEEEWFMKTALEGNMKGDGKEILGLYLSYIYNTFSEENIPDGLRNDLDLLAYEKTTIDRPEFKFDLDKSTHEGEPAKDKDYIVKALGDTPLYFAKSGDCLFFLGYIGTTDDLDFNSRISKIHFYDKSGSEVASKEFKFRGSPAYASMFVIEDFPDNAASYSVDLVDYYSGDYPDELEKEYGDKGEPINVAGFDWAVFGHGDFGYDDNATEEGSANRYNTYDDYEKAHRLYAFRMCKDDAYKDSGYTFYKIVCGFKVSDDGKLEDPIFHKFEVDADKKVDIQELEENRVWIAIND